MVSFQVFSAAALIADGAEADLEAAASAAVVEAEAAVLAVSAAEASAVAEPEEVGRSAAFSFSVQPKASPFGRATES